MWIMVRTGERKDNTTERSDQKKIDQANDRKSRKMKTWFEKCYGEPAPTKERKVIEENLKALDERIKEIKKTAWHQAKSDYLNYIRNESQRTI